VPQVNRLKDLVHYVCWACKDAPARLGATKLNKIAWFVDGQWFVQTGRSITDARYEKLQFGPVPKGIVFAVSELEASGAVDVRMVDYFGKPKREFHAKVAPAADLFSDAEKVVIDATIAAVCDGHSARSISEHSHDAIWTAARMREDIPLHAILASDLDAPTEVDIQWARGALNRAAA